MFEENQENKCATHKIGALYKAWLGIKNDYRTLIGLEDLFLVELDITEDEVSDDE